MTLTENEYIYAVSLNSVDDYTVNYESYWTDRKLAEKRAKEISGCVIQTTLYKDNFDRWYVVSKQLVMVDLPSKKDVLDKLTEKEKYVLGLTK